MQKDYKNFGAGSFDAIFKDRFNTAVQHRPEYARRPNRAHFDKDEDYKVRNTAKPPWNVFGSFMDLINIYYMMMAKTFMMRAKKEVRLSTSKLFYSHLYC